MAKCPICGGTGNTKNIIGKPQTEQEYIQTCNTEQLAEVLCIVSVWGYNEGTLSKEEAIQWLKQPHTKE